LYYIFHIFGVELLYFRNKFRYYIFHVFEEFEDFSYFLGDNIMDIFSYVNVKVLLSFIT